MRIIYLAAIVLTLLLSSRATAQLATPWAPSLEEPWLSRITQATIDLAAETLSLTDEQRAMAAEWLNRHRERFDAFVDQHRPIVDELNERSKGLSPKKPAFLYAELEREEKVAVIADQQAALDDEFLARLHGMISEDQEERWGAFVAAVHRKWWMRALTVAEEGIDLTAMARKILEDAKIEETPPELDAMLRDYAVALDVKLTAQVKDYVQSCRKHMRDDVDRWKVDGDTLYMGEGKPGWEAKFWAQRKRTFDLHRQIAEVNRQYRPQVEALLPEAVRDEFTRMYLVEAMAEPLQRAVLPAQRYVEQDLLVRAVNANELAVDQVQAIQGVRDAYRGSFRTRAEAIIKAYDKQREGRFKKAELSEWEQDEQRVRDAVADLFDLERTTIDLAWGMLRPEQQAKYKKPKVASPNREKPDDEDETR